MADVKNYAKVLELIHEYYGVSSACANYMYHRAIRSQRKGVKYLAWPVQLQNAIVRADQCLGIYWDKIIFGQEADILLEHGINIDEMCSEVFRWNESPTDWIQVKNKRQKKNSLLKRLGLHV